MFTKILVANRGEIAIRAFRAAVELGAKTVAVYPFEDRNSLHRLKADEAYQIGEPGHPVRAYLDVSEIIRVARESGADAIYPGYGFLSENPELAQAAAEAGITFIGPPKQVLEMAGNKVTAKEHAIAAGVPVLKSTPPSRDIEELVSQSDEVGFPIFAKAVAGGGGRGMRRVNTKDDLRGALEEAMREADSAFGDPTMFLEQAVLRPRHIEVQVLADATGETVHLFERDCSVQRRHQKVIEIAPAPNLSDDVRQSLYRDAIAFAKSIGYVNAGTVEFLLDTAGERAGQHVFIEMNPRIQVEHTVTEEVTDVDLVRVADPHRGGGDPRRPRPRAGRHPTPRGRTAVPHHHRGPDGRVPARHRQDHDVPLARRRRHPTRRRHRQPRGADQPPLRLDAREAHLPRARLPGGGRPRQARTRRVPHPRRLHEHLVPAGRARGPGVHRGRPEHLVHRRAAAARARTRLEGPRHQDPQLAGGCHGQPAERDRRRPPSTRSTSCPRST